MTAPATPRTSTYDLFLAFCPAATLVASDLPSIALDASARVVAVDLYYRAETDVALVGLRLDAQVMTQSFLTALRNEAASAGASVLEPARLGPPDRARFYSEHLAQYKFRVLGFPTVADAARKLSTDLGSGGPRAATGGSPRVKVRWRAGDRWFLARARNLTREGFYVYASAPPRAGDNVSLALEAGPHAVTLRAVVVHVTPDDAAVTVGGPGFGGRFLIERVDERLLLEKIVVAGRGEGLASLRAAPSRREARYAARWPVSLGGQPAVPAIDLSRHGLFVATADTAMTGRIDVRIAAHDGGAALRAQVRVARVVTAADARTRGITAGLGLELESFGVGDANRYEALVARVGERSRRRLLVGATPMRLAAVVDPLAAAGYVVTGVSVPADLDLHLAAGRHDLVVLDAGFGKRPRPPGSCVLESGRDSTVLVTVDDALVAKA